MAIENRQQLEHTQSQITKLELVLDTLKREKSAAGYRLLSEGFVEEIAQHLMNAFFSAVRSTF